MTAHFEFAVWVTSVSTFVTCWPRYISTAIFWGFSISDPLDFGHRVENPEERKALGDTVGYFMRHGTDHHSFVVFPKRVLDKFAGRPETSDMTVNQITWQVGSLREVVDTTAWFKENAIHFNRSGRDTPGSNWHVYPVDPEGHTNELYYGIEQIGWDGKSKPKRNFRSTISGGSDASSKIGVSGN